MAAAFSPDGTRVVTASAGQDGAAVGRGDRPAPPAALEGHDGAVEPRPSAPTARRLVTGVAGQDGAAVGRRDRRSPSARSRATRARCWARGLQPRRRARRHRVARTRRRGCGTPAPASRSARPRGPRGRGAGPRPSAPTARRVVTAVGDETARLWDAATGSPIGDASRATQGRVLGRGLQPRRHARRSPPVRRQDGAAVGRGHRRSPLGPPLGHEGRCRPRPSAPTARGSLTALRDKTARLWDAATGKPARPALRPRGGGGAAAFSPDGTRVVTACGDSTARLWDVHLEDRPPETIARLVRCYVPFALVDEQLLPVKPAPRACQQ